MNIDGGFERKKFSKYKSSFMSVIFLLKVYFKIKLSFLLGGVVLSGASTRGMYLGLALHVPRFLVGTSAQESKKSAMFQPSEASSATAIHYGLCLSLVLSGKPRLSTAIWRNFWHGRIRKAEGLLRKSFAMVLSVKRLDRGLWGKCATSREC